ncbi:MAG: hypothetical protein QM630_07720 [Microbacterium sp.]
MTSELPETPVPPDSETDGEFIDDGVLYDEEVAPEYGILGFTLRELLIVGVWLVHFVVSFVPIVAGSSLWSTGIEWLLPVGIPTVAVFLIVLRRFSPDGIRRVGSLGIDQFASVAFSVAAAVLVSRLWLAVATLIASGFWALSWSGIVLVLTALALVALTVFAPLIPGLKEDFHGRLVTLAHRAANPVRPVIARPRPEPLVHTAAAEQPAQAGRLDADDAELSAVNSTDGVDRIDLAFQVPLSAHASGGGTGTEEPETDEDYTPRYSRRSVEPEIVYDTDSIVELVGEAADLIETPASEQAAASEQVDVEATNSHETVVQMQPFWILAPTERDVHDESGEAIFRIGPSAWALVIEDRGGAFVVRHDDGRIGYLHDISDITKG